MKDIVRYDWLGEDPQQKGKTIAASPQRSQNAPPKYEETPSIPPKSSKIWNGVFATGAAVSALLFVTQTEIGKKFVGAAKSDDSSDAGFPKWSERQKEYFQQRSRAEDSPDQQGRQWNVLLEVGDYLCHGRMDVGSNVDGRNDAQKFGIFTFWDPSAASTRIPITSIGQLDKVIEVQSVPAIQTRVICEPYGDVDISSREGRKTEHRFAFFVATNPEAEEPTREALLPILANLRTSLEERKGNESAPHSWLPIANGESKEEVALDFLKLILERSHAATEKDGSGVLSSLR